MSCILEDRAESAPLVVWSWRWDVTQAGRSWWGQDPTSEQGNLVGMGSCCPVSDPSNLVEAAYGFTCELWLHSLLIRTPSSMLLGVCPASAKAGKTWELFKGLLSFWSGRQSFWQEVGGKRERVAPRMSWFDPAFDPHTFDPATVMVKVASSAHICIVKSQRSFERWRAWQPGAEETGVCECTSCPDLILEGTVLLREECLFPWHLIGGTCVMEPLLSSVNGIPWSPLLLFSC